MVEISFCNKNGDNCKNNGDICENKGGNFFYKNKGDRKGSYIVYIKIEDSQSL